MMDVAMLQTSELAATVVNSPHVFRMKANPSCTTEQHVGLSLYLAKSFQDILVPAAKLKPEHEQPP